MDKASSSCNLYLVLVYVVVGMGISSTSYFFNQVPFMIQKQVYTCQLIDPAMIDNATEICIAENICAEDPRILSWEVDYSSELSLDNWI